MPSCSVQSCKNWNQNTRNEKIQFHRIPKDEATAKIWIDFCNNKKINLKNGIYKISDNFIYFL